MGVEPSKIEQVIAELERLLDELPPGSKLPSDRELGSKLGVARGTIRSAVDRLHDRILFIPGRGRFVRPRSG